MRHDLLFQVKYPDGRLVGEGAVITFHPGAGFAPNPIVRRTYLSGNSWLFLGPLDHIPTDPTTTRSLWTWEAEFVDAQGITWTGGGTKDIIVAKGKLISPRHNSNIVIELHRKPNPLPHLIIRHETIESIRGPEGGMMVLSDLDEMLTAVRVGLPSSTLAMAGKTLEGFLRLKGKKERWWKARYDGLTVGQLLAENKIEEIVKRRIGEGYWGRLRGSSVYVRNQGVHNNLTQVTGAESVSAAEIVLHTLNSWPSR